MIALSDKQNMNDIAKLLASKDLTGGVKKTRIRIFEVNEDGSENFKGEYENKVVITGSAIAGATLFDIGLPFRIPSYNSELELENSVYTERTNPQLITLFCVGDSGCGATDTDIFVPKYVDRIAPVDDIVPFRFVDALDDISVSEREIYYGRKVYSDLGRIAYFFKTFESTPVLFMRYADGTEMDASMYNTQTSQEAECFVKTELMVNRIDCRDWFEHMIGWDRARISTISLCSAWYTTKDGFKWFQNILPFTKLNFSFERLVDSTKALKFEYSLFF